MNELPVLLVGGDSASREQLENVLRKRGYPVVLAGTSPTEIVRRMQGGVDLVLVALPSDGERSGEQLMSAVRKEAGTEPIIVVGVDESVTSPVDAFAMGARDYVESAGDTAKVLEALGLALGTSRRDSQLRFLHSRAVEAANWTAVVGECEAMRRVMALVQQIVTRTTSGHAPPILITGETGTGKGMLARCIHYNSARRNEPLVDVNCAAIPPTLIESELFGHEKGSFTDARGTRPGLFETANGGSLFLDEIATLPIDLQAKLLVAVEEKRVRRIGSRVSKTIDVQLIAATHSDLSDRVQNGLFREDLYHRLNVLAVELPPLRMRTTDKVLLAKKFAVQMCKEYGIPVRRFSKEAESAICEYRWPGNVRELKNQIERILLLENDLTILPEHFHFAESVGGAAPAPSAELEVDRHESGLRIKLPDEGFSLQQLELAVLKGALERCAGNVSKAARYLRISRQTLIYRMKKYGLGASSLPESQDG